MAKNNLRVDKTKNNYYREQKVLNTDNLDEDLLLLDELLEEEMYEQSENRLYKFHTNFWDCHDPAVLRTNWYHECIAEHLQAALKRQIRRLIICIPPRSGKSTLASISFPVWSWLKYPHEKFWLISHGSKLFTQNIVLARRVLEHPRYKERWCLPKNQEHFKFRLSDDVNTKTRIENTEGGYLLGGSPTSGALGLGYSVAVLDDILDSEESQSPLAVQSVNDWFTQTFLNRSNDVRNDVVIIVMQRLHQSDLVNYVKTTYGDQNWLLLNLPAKYEPDRTFISPLGFNDRRTKRNELLDPVRLPDEFLITQAKNILIYNTRYQQNPDATAEGNLMKLEWIVESEIKPISYSSMVVVWDLSFTDSPKSAYTVGLVVCRFEDKFYIIDMFRQQCDIPEQLDAIRKLKKKYPRATIAVEKKANGNAAISLLNREIVDIYAIEPRLFGGSKEQRFDAVLPYFRDKKVIIYSPFKPDFKLESSYSALDIKNELKSFPLSQYDDIVDCVSYAIQILADKDGTSEALITKGERIRIADEDFFEENPWFKKGIINTDVVNTSGFELPFGNNQSISYIKDEMFW